MTAYTDQGQQHEPGENDKILHLKEYIAHHEKKNIHHSGGMHVYQVQVVALTFPPDFSHSDKSSSSEV